MRKTIWSIFLTLALTSHAYSQTSPLQLTVAFPAGSGTDINARIFAEFMRDELGRPVVIQNRGGASGTIGSRAVASSAPDGNNLGFLTSVPITLQPHLMKLDLSPGDFTPICRITEVPTTLVASPKSGFESLAQVVEAARQKPGAINLGVPGLNSAPHLAGMQLMESAKIDLFVIPHQADNNAIAPLKTGEINLAFAQPPFGPTHNFKVLGISSRARFPTLPDVPTFAELGFPVVNTASIGLMGPRDMLAEATQKLEAACKKILENPEFRNRMAAASVVLTYATGADYKRQLEDDWNTMKKTAQSIKPLK
jgi:tripartite-type tricarboxylate transporter receptor subunit TctC